MANDMFEELKNLKNKLKNEEKVSKEKIQNIQKKDKEEKLIDMFESYMKDVKVKKINE